MPARPMSRVFTESLVTVEIKDAVAVYQLLGKGVVPANLVDFLPGVVGQAHHLGRTPPCPAAPGSAGRYPGWKAADRSREVVWVRLMICRTWPSLHGGAAEEQASSGSGCRRICAWTPPPYPRQRPWRTWAARRRNRSGCRGPRRPGSSMPWSWASLAMARMSEQMP